MEKKEEIKRHKARLDREERWVLLAEIEALLFVAGEDGIRVRQVGWTPIASTTGIQQSLEKLAQKYEKTKSRACPWSRQVVHTDWSPSPQFAAILKEYSKAPINQSLSRAALETLSIIAYKQPITRIEIDAIRGVNSSGALAKLLAFDLIREDGKKKFWVVPISMWLLKRRTKTTDDYKRNRVTVGVFWSG